MLDICSSIINNEYISFLASCVISKSRYDRLIFQVLGFDYLKIANNKFFRKNTIVTVQLRFFTENQI